MLKGRLTDINMQIIIIIIINELSDQGWNGLGMWHEWGAENACRIFVVKPEGKRSLGIPGIR